MKFCLGLEMVMLLWERPRLRIDWRRLQKWNCRFLIALCWPKELLKQKKKF